MPGRISYLDPREQYPPEAAGLPGSPVTIEGAGGFGRGGYETGAQTAYVPAAGQPIYGQGVSPQAAAYLGDIATQGEQLNVGYEQQAQADIVRKRANLEREWGKDFADYYHMLRSGPNPVPVNEAKEKAFAYKAEQDRFRAKFALEQSKAAAKTRKPDYAKFKQEINKVNTAGQPIYGVQDIPRLGEQFDIPPEQVSSEINAMTDAVRLQATGLTERQNSGMPTQSLQYQPQPSPQPQQNIPTVEEFIRLAKPLNPGMTDNEIADEFYLRYGQ